MEKLIKKLIIKTELEVLTGLHIGGNSDNVEIGGIDNPVIKIGTKNGQPYIPGSSLKGKMRSLLEQIAGAAEVGGGTKKDGKDYKYKDKPKEIRDIIDLFGFANDNKPSKIIVRDAYLANAEGLKENDFLDMPYTESKWENVIDRIKGTAEHPRQIERVPAGAKFNVEFVINVWDSDEDGQKSLKLLKKGIEVLENDYLGGSGTRGYGKVKFSPLKIEELDLTKIFENEAEA